jgi:FkbM family methyltransferase
MHGARGPPHDQVSKFGALKRIRRHFRNWPTVLLLYYLGRSPRAVRLRNGTVLQFGADGRIDPGILVQLVPRLLEAGWTIQPVDRTHALISNSRTGTKLMCRFLPHWSDVMPLLEVYEDKVYGEEFQGKVVLDVGMANGDSSIFFAQHGAKLVIGLEPIPESYELAKGNIERNGLDATVIPLHAALHSGLGKIVIKVASAAPNRSSVAPENDKTVINFDTNLEVETVGVLDLVKRFGIDRIDYVKMDCEGCEYNVLRSLPKELLGKIGTLEFEFHDGPQDLPDLLRSSGFQVQVEGGPVGYLRATRSAS